MVKPHIAIFQSEKGLDGLQVLLSRMGFAARAFFQLRGLRSYLQKIQPDLVLVEKDLPAAQKAVFSEGISEDCPVLLVAKEEDFFLFFDPLQQQIFHLVDLHEYFREHLERYSRQHLRLAVDLPGLLCLGESSHFAQIVNLGTGGAFVKTGLPHLDKDDVVEMTIPLIGQNAELEVRGRVVYRVRPGQENNYFQGAGISFAQPDDASIRLVRNYLASTLTEKAADGMQAGASISPLSATADKDGRRICSLLSGLR